MQKTDFFSGIQQSKVQVGPYKFNIPVFYRDMMNLDVQILAPLDKVKNILPSGRMHPFRITPWHGLVSISAFEYRDTDIGPYNEVGISIPFILDSVSPVFTGVLRKLPEVPMTYIYKLPVTTEIARATGVEGASFPKFLAEISFDSKDQWLNCRVDADGMNIFTISVRKTQLKPSKRTNLYPVTLWQDRLLRTEFNLSECEAGLSKKRSDIILELGDHPVGLELKALNLGRTLFYQYCPSRQAILMPVCESYSVEL